VDNFGRLLAILVLTLHYNLVRATPLCAINNLKTKTMKANKIFFYYLSVVLILYSHIAQAQFAIQHSATPLVGSKGVFGVIKKVPKICVEPRKERMDSALNAAKNNPHPQGIGVPIDVNITMENSGKWKKTKTHRIWTLQIEAIGADQLFIGFDSIQLPEDADISYYSADKKYLASPHVNNLNRMSAEGRKVALPPLNQSGTISSIIIEYRELLNSNNKGRFKIDKIIFGRFLNKKQSSLRNGADESSCEIDINCTEGNCWHSEGMGIGNINISTAEYGTGVLLNTTLNNGKLYLYTARHVVSNLNDLNIQFSAVNFLFKSISCNGTSNQQIIYYPIKSILAISAINDFALLELVPDPNPANNEDHKLTYLGWSRESINPPASPITCLHHPDDPTAGGSFPLRISASSNAVSTNTNEVVFSGVVGTIAPNRLWNVQYPLGQRVAESSSGSPLFDANHILRGHLVGGDSDCNVVGNNWYGRFDIAWEGEGTPATALKYWLDPGNTNTESMPTRNPIQFECIGDGSTPQASISAFNINSTTPLDINYSFFWTINGDASLLFESIDVPYAEIEYADNGNNGIFEVCYDLITPTACTDFLGNTTCQTYKWHDLYMKDGVEDSGIEPNTVYHIRDYTDYDGDGDYWEIINGDMWDSPDLWNRTNAVANFSTAPKAHQDLEQNSAGTNTNTAMIEVRNRGVTCSPAANVHLYWALASTGELWNSDESLNDWVSSLYACGPLDITVGDQIGTISIPAGDIVPSSSKKYGVHWLPPSATTFSACGISPDGHNGLDFTGVFEVCLLARLESAEDPIIGEQNGAIKPNVLNSNNIVTRNSFIVPISPLPPSGGIISPTDIVKYILIKNSDDFIANLNITFESLIKNLSDTDCGNDFYIDFVLSPELWEKWESTGKKSEGISIIAPYIVRITDCSIAKLLDVPFEAMEVTALGIKAQAISGKTENTKLPNFSFKVSHEATNPIQTIKQASACLFRVVNGNASPQNEQIMQNSSLKTYPNPTTNGFIVDFDVEYMPLTASIILYNINGTKIDEIAALQHYGIGNHKIYFDATAISSGFYFVVLQSDQYKKVAKIIKM
jgi:lysyl endopeptidase